MSWRVGGLVALTLALIPVAVAAQDGGFSGRVVDERSAQGVSGATVSIAGLPGTVKTDTDGRFTWAPPPTPPFQVIVVLPGGQVAQPITVDRLAGDTVNIPVNPLADESLTVVGAAPSVTIAPAAGTTLLSHLQLVRRSPESLVQALETVPGVHQVSEGHAAVPAIRGMARGRTLLLIDGARVSSERRVGSSATFADPTTFEGIDVARGPGSVAYGSDALGGVISVRTRRAEPGTPLRLRANATWGAGIPERRGTFEVSKGLAAGGVLAQIHVREADDWDSPEGAGEVFNSGWKDRGLLTRIDHQLGRGVLSATLQADFGRDIERPRNNSRSIRFYNPYEDSHRFTAGYDVLDLATFQRVTVHGFFGASKQRIDQDRFPTAAAPRLIERGDLSAKDFHVKGNATRKLRAVRLELGIDANGRFDLEAIDTIIHYSTAGSLLEEDTNVSIESGRRTNLGAYVQAYAPLGKLLRLSGGVRADRVTTRNSGGYFGEKSTVHGALSGFGSATVGPFAGLSVTGQLARGFRDPTLSDRYFRGPTGRGIITGNPELDPETSLQGDLSVRYSLPRTQLAGYVYQYRIDDLIERYMDGPDVFYFRNRGRARLRGLELEMRAELGNGFAVEVGGTFAEGVALDDGAHLDDVAPRAVTLLARKDFARRGYAQVRGTLQDANDRPGPSEVAAPGATIVDVAAGVHLTKHLELRGNVRNLLDDSYYASPDLRWVHAPGRSASVTLAVQY